MLTYLTETPDGSFAGPNVFADTCAEAMRQASAQGVQVIGVLIEEVPASDDLVACIKRGLRITELPVVG
jgi:hypothetical protein